MIPTGAGQTTRAGRYIRQPTGYRAFIPAPLPPDPPLQIDNELLTVLSDADQALGRLDGSTEMLPNPNLFVAVYVKKEAVLSSQIEGTQASLSDVLEYEAMQASRRPRGDVSEVVNYVAAMNHGLERLKTLPLSNRLLREIHAVLLQEVRGQEKLPGEFRRSQVWFGGIEPMTAEFVPPPHLESEHAMAELESYIHTGQTTPVLIKAGLIHSQFEIIHPFLDGNGRMGRLLITFFLCHLGVLKRPILYLSAYLKQHQTEYYERLQAVRDSGDWEGWLKFFLRAVFEVSREATDTAHRIIAMREMHRHVVEQVTGSVYGLDLLDLLFKQPYIAVTAAAQALQVSYPMANGLVKDFMSLGLLAEITGQKRNRIFAYQPYLQLLDRRAKTATPTA